MIASIDTFLFDLDDTLYDEMTFVESGFRTVATHLATHHALVAETLFAFMMQLLADEGRGKIFDRVLDYCSLHDTSQVSDLVSLYRFHPPAISLYPDVVPLFQSLRESGKKVGIITDGLHTVQKNKVAALGLHQWADLIVYTDELGRERWKPHPAAFELALKRLGGHPAGALYVGNDPSKDFTGPTQLGMTAIQIHRAGKGLLRSQETPYHITDLNELLPLLEGGTP